MQEGERILAPAVVNNHENSALSPGYHTSSLILLDLYIYLVTQMSGDFFPPNSIGGKAAEK